jgi:uncharacterized protein (DUF2237 family)
MPTNILGEPLECCCLEPRTGFYRDGYCHTGPGDSGLHTVCAVMTAAFLEFALRQGNDLISPRPEYDFPGLHPGDRWCVCVTTWVQALEHGVAPPIHLAATHSSVVEFASLEDLQAHSAT